VRRNVAVLCERVYLPVNALFCLGNKSVVWHIECVVLHICTLVYLRAFCGAQRNNKWRLSCRAACQKVPGTVQRAVTSVIVRCAPETRLVHTSLVPLVV
jgi:hypothetical protein